MAAVDPVHPRPPVPAMIAIVQKSLRRLRHGKPIVVVSGLPRSGTSMMMQMLVAGGMDPVTDGLRPPDRDNPEGYLEYQPVKDLAHATDKRWLHDARGRAVKIIAFLLEHLPETHNYRVVFMNRKLDEVLVSQSKMLERLGEADETDDGRMRQNFIHHLARTKTMLSHRPHFEVHHVRYPEVIDDPRGNARAVRHFLGAHLDIDAMAAVVRPELYRNRH